MIVHTKTGERVASLLRDEIVAGRVRPGENLRLMALAEQFGVSTTPVREALAMLERQGLVVGEAHKGFRVTHLSPEDFQDVYLLHGFIAGVLAERAADRLSEQDLDYLASIEKRIKEATHQEDLATAAELNHTFHRTINRSAQSTLLLRFLAESTPFVTRRRDPFVPGWSSQAVLEHDPIIDALRQHDGPLARRLMEQHILHSGELVRAHWEEEGSLEDGGGAGSEADLRQALG